MEEEVGLFIKYLLAKFHLIKKQKSVFRQMELCIIGKINLTVQFKHQKIQQKIGQGGDCFSLFT